MHQNVAQQLVVDATEELIKKKKSVCHWLKVGKNGRREKCCTYFTICRQNKKKVTTCFNTKRVCKWTSQLVKSTQKSRCFWKRHAGGKQRKCCRWTVKCFGNKCFNLRKKCIWKGQIVTVARDHGCRWVIVGKNARRQQCCQQIRKCVGKKCIVKNTKNCKWKTPVISHDWITRCSWKKKKATNIKTCCSFFKRCVGKKCIVKKNTCKVTDKTTIKRSKECTWKEYKKGRRQQCCTYSTFCKNKLCRKLFRKCKWVGKIVWWTSNQKCAWKKKTKNTRQKRCCKYIKKCTGNQCKTIKKLCDWRGHPIYSKLIKNCRWVADHKEGSKQYCCKRVKFCTKKKCKFINRKCGFTGVSIQWKSRTSCKWAKFKDYKQRRCCYSRIRCRNHKNCRNFKESCRYIGPKVTSQKKTTCRFIKEGNGRRKNCCSYIRYCYGDKCRDINKKCHTGKLITYRNSSKCFFEGVVKGWERKVCCASSIKCLDNKCGPVRRICKVTAIRRKTPSKLKLIELKKRAFENEKKKKLKKLNFVCNCLRQESQNLKVFIEKRKSSSKRFQSCKKSESNLKILINKTKSAAQITKFRAQLTRTGKNCLRIYKKLQKMSKQVISHKRYVATKKVECEKENNDYRTWMTKINFNEKKSRSFERKQERIERAALVKKYESKDEKSKIKIEVREANIKKDIQKLSIECRKTQQDLLAVKNIAAAVDKRFLRVEKKCKRLQKGLKKQKKSLRKTRKNIRRPKKALRKRVLRQKLKTQKRESSFLSCKKQLEVIRAQKKKSDENYRNAIRNNNNCRTQLRTEKNTITKIEKREVRVQKNLKRLLTPKVKRPAPVQRPAPVPRPPRAVVNRRIPRPRPMTRRRGGRGDVWLQDKFGNWIDVNVVGTFTYIKDSNNKFDVDVQFGQIGLGSVISAIVVRARGNTIRAERNGQITLNNRLIKETSGIFVFNGNNVQLQKVTSKSPGLFVLQGLRSELLSFKYFKNLKSYDIQAESADNVSGLFRDPVNPKKYILSQKESKFAKYIGYSVNDESDGNEEQRVAAAKCCRKLSKNDQVRCKKDFYRTDVCFAEEYKAVLPLREKNTKKFLKKRK